MTGGVRKSDSTEDAEGDNLAMTSLSIFIACIGTSRSTRLQDAEAKWAGSFEEAMLPIPRFQVWHFRHE